MVLGREEVVGVLKELLEPKATVCDHVGRLNSGPMLPGGGVVFLANAEAAANKACLLGC